MKRLLPAPLLSAALFVLWLLLNQSLSPGNLLLALVVAWLVPLLTRGLRPLPVRIRRPGTVLRLGLENRGTSFSDYRDAEGNLGSNQDQLNAYGRFGLPCLRCGTPLRRTTVAQRTSSWCPRCQR